MEAKKSYVFSTSAVHGKEVVMWIRNLTDFVKTFVGTDRGGFENGGVVSVGDIE